MSPEKLSDHYYTARQARAVLGLDEHRFQYEVKTGRIPSKKIPGRKQNVYPKRDVDALALALNMALEQEERVIFSRSSPADQVEEMDIGIRAFGSEFITPLSERITFQQKSEFTFWSLKADGQVVAYISMFRFSPEFLDDLLTGQRIEREITVRDVLPFVRDEPFDIYIDVLAVDPRIPWRLHHEYAEMIVSRFARTILNLLANHYRIQTLYTVTTTKEGDKLVRRRGFHLMTGKSQAKGRQAYRLDLDEVGIARLEELSRRGE